MVYVTSSLFSVPGQPKKVSRSFYYYFHSKTAMTTIVTPLERGRAGESFKKNSIFKKSILRCLNQYSNFPDMQTRFWLYDFISGKFEYFRTNFLKFFLFSNHFPARPLSNGVTIVVIAVLEGK